MMMLFFLFPEKKERRRTLLSLSLSLFEERQVLRALLSGVVCDANCGDGFGPKRMASRIAPQIE